jgi:hypothetical protein
MVSKRTLQIESAVRHSVGLFVLSCALSVTSVAGRPGTNGDGKRQLREAAEDEYYLFDFEEKAETIKDNIPSETRQRIPVAWAELFSENAIFSGPSASTDGGGGGGGGGGRVTRDNTPAKPTSAPTIGNPYGYASTRDDVPPRVAVSESEAEKNADGEVGSRFTAASTTAVAGGVACIGALIAAAMLVALRRRKRQYAQSLEAYTMSSSGSSMGRSRISRRFSTDESGHGMVVE